MREELQSYLDKVYPHSKVETPHSIPGQVHIRFELGGDELFRLYRNGVEYEYWKDRRRMTKTDKINEKIYCQNRVLQATSRATNLFYETFDNIETIIWVIIYEYRSGLFNRLNDYVLQLFSEKYVSDFYNEVEEVETQMVTTDENGVDTFDKTEARVIVGRVKVKDIKVEKIVNGIANNEMGMDPNICQDIYFLDPITDRGFYMYDDRGCYVWSDKAEKIKYLYLNRNNWIVEDWRSHIDEYFNKK